MTENMKNFVRLVPFFGKTMGSLCQATLYEISDGKLSVAASTDYLECDGDETREFILSALNDRRIQKKGSALNHTVINGFSAIVKLSVMFIYNESGEAEGALCISMPCDSLIRLQTILSGLLQLNNVAFDDENAEDESEDKNVISEKDITLDTIGEYIRGFGVEPGRVSQEERMEIICDLFDMGIFNLKGSVARAAEELQVSEQSVYRYLTKIKKARQ